MFRMEINNFYMKLRTGKSWPVKSFRGRKKFSSFFVFRFHLNLSKANHINHIAIFF